MTVQGSQFLDEGQAHQLLDDGDIFGVIGTMELQDEAEVDKAEGTPRGRWPNGAPPYPPAHLVDPRAPAVPSGCPSDRR